MTLSFIKNFERAVYKKKLSLLEDFDLSQYIENSQVKIEREPFPHFVIDNFFKDDFAQKIQKMAYERLNRGLSEGYDNRCFTPFLDLKGEFEYDGYKYPIKLKEDRDELPVFFSLAWNNFFSKAFNQPTSTATSASFHYHPVGDRTGFIHHDYVAHPFSHEDRLPNGVIYRTREGFPPREDYYDEARIIALLYYFGIDDWVPGDGGGTGIYKKGEQSPCEVSEPLHNRLFAFQISPKSFHAFQTNRKPRFSIVQWFHIDPEWCEKKYGEVRRSNK